MAGLIDAIADPHRRRLDARDIAVVVAHPDDETVGCGGLLGRLDGATLVVVTDGAPRDLRDASAHGFATAADYAAARAGELAAACALAGLAPDRIVRLGIADQRAAFALAPLARRLAALLEERRIATVLTHAYEGGHPDHDAACFAVHAAGRLPGAHPCGGAASRRPVRGTRTLPLFRGNDGLSRGRLSIIEMPFYRLGHNGMAVRSFATEDRSTVRLALTPAERDRKRRMLAAHRTQAAVLAPFGAEAELFRPAPRHRFTEPPNGGRLLYDRYDWGLSGAAWPALAEAALTELGLGEDQ